MDLPNNLKAKVSAKGWVVIPASLRKRFGLKPGTIVDFYEEGDKIALVPRSEDPVEAVHGKLSGKTSLTDALLEDRAEELMREEAILHPR